jgi:hypothetical protein
MYLKTIFLDGYGVLREGGNFFSIKKNYQKKNKVDLS